MYSTVLTPQQVAQHFQAAGGVLPNQAPTAALTATAAGLALSVDGSGSSDADGTLASYAWTFGDNSTGTGATASHTYAAAGTYTVTLTVTDNAGATGTATQSVTVTAANVAPTAAFTSAATNLKIDVDGTTSTDPDGTLASYAWNFGDNSTGTGATASHTYAAAGTYTVTLTVTDNAGTTNTTSKPVTVTAAAPTAIATDLFARTVAGGWGTSDPGGAWTMNGSSSLFSVNGSAGQIKMATAGAGPSVNLTTVSATELNGSVDIALDKLPTGSGFQGNAIVRRVGTTNYMVKLRLMPTSTSIQISKVVAGVETVLSTQTVTGLTYAVGDQVRLSFQVKGTSPTTISAKAWKVGSTEPTAWRATVTDNDAALQAAGTVGLQGYLTSSSTNAPVVASFDNLSITPVTP